MPTAKKTTTKKPVSRTKKAAPKRTVAAKKATPVAKNATPIKVDECCSSDTSCCTGSSGGGSCMLMWILFILNLVLSAIVLFQVCTIWNNEVARNGGKENMSVLEELFTTENFIEQQANDIQQFADSIK